MKSTIKKGALGFFVGAVFAAFSNNIFTFIGLVGIFITLLMVREETILNDLRKEVEK